MNRQVMVTGIKGNLAVLQTPKTIHNSLHRLVCLGLLLTLLASAGVSLSGQSLDDTEKTYIVLLKESSVIEHLIESTPAVPSTQRRNLLSTREVEAYSQRVQHRQQAFVERIAGQNTLRSRGTGHKVLGARTLLLNTVFVKATEQEIRLIEQDPEVRQVYESQLSVPLLDSAVEMVNSSTLWEALGGFEEAGKGVKIGIIDSGINPDHEMFDGSGLTTPAGYPKSNTPAGLAFTSSKIVVARSYHELFPNEQPNRTPEDELGHGSRVASIAAGRPVDAPLAPMSGVAPMAYLGNYKVFGAPGVNSTATSASIIAAINDAVADGMDVINLSLGGPARNPATDPEQIAIDLAVKAGAVVVVSGGNAGPSTGTITSPGTSPVAITVGSVSNARVFAAGITFESNGPLPDNLHLASYTPGEGINISNPIGPLPVVPVSRFDPTELACQAFPPGSLAGSIALVRRGTCYFQDKAENVFAAGAELLLVYNNTSEGHIVMAFEEGGPGGPALMIDLSSGEGLRDFIKQGYSVEAMIQSSTQLSRFPAPGNVLTSFSSRGPSIDGAIKPDLTAVGNRMYTASKDPGVFALNSSGTSFSAPMVAGAAALLKQLRPSWPPSAIKSALVSTAVQTPTWEGAPLKLNQGGNGVLDLSRAVAAEIVIDPVSVSFGTLSDPDLFRSDMSRMLTLTNLTEKRQALSLRFESSQANPSSVISVAPNELTLGPWESAEILVTLAFTDAPTSGVFEGFVRVLSHASSFEISAPVGGAIALGSSGVTLKVSQLGDGDFTSLEDALDAVNPGNTIEITDSATYPIRKVIEFNQDGLRLDGLTIRNSPGKSPVLDGTELSQGDAVLHLRNLQNVTLEGLGFRGGRQGVRAENSSVSLINNRISADDSSASGYGVLLNDSEAHLVENHFSNAGGAAVSSTNSEILMQYNRIAATNASERIAENGIFLNSNTQAGIFDNVIQGSGAGTSGQGIRLSGGLALIKGNVISGTAGSFADGILVRGQFSRSEVIQNLLAENARAGISFFDGATGSVHLSHLARNTIAGMILDLNTSVAAGSL
ncbi:MAG: S8 family serine peptidase, partial [Acidobacteriota bacterium]